MDDPMLEQTPARNCSLWRRAHAVADFLAPEGSTLEQFLKDCILWVGPQAGGEEEHEEEGAAEEMCDELTTACVPHLSALLKGEEAAESRRKLSLRRREGWGEVVYVCSFFLIILLCY